MSRVAILILLLLQSISVVLAENSFYNTAPPYKSKVIPGYSIEKAKANLDIENAVSIEGIWYFPHDVITLSIERLESKNFSKKFKYRVVLLDSEDRSLSPGTVMGYIEEASQSNRFFLWLYAEQDDETLCHPIKCTATFDESDGSLIFVKSEIKIKWRVNLTRFLPSLFRMLSISVEKVDDKIPLGFKRIYPSSEKSDKIRYL